MEHYRATTPVLLALVLFLTALPGSIGSGMVIPLYTYPDVTWTMTASVKQAYPSVSVLAVINPNSGPGTSQDPNFVTGTTMLAQSSVVVMGYVATTYSNKPLATAKAEIDKYPLWYPNVTGIFLDEMSNTPGNENYYSSLTAYIKNTKNLTYVVGNPGTDTTASYVGTVDTIVIYEGSGYPPISYLGGWHDSYPPQRWAMIAYNCSSLNVTFVQQALVHTGFIFITNGTLPNPYNSLPTYFESLTAALA